MTRYELMELLNFKTMAPISNALRQAKKVMPNLKKNRYNPFKENDMSLEEVMCLCDFLWKKPRPLVKEWVKEHYIKHDKAFIVSKGARNTLFEGSIEYIQNPINNCCSTCENCIPMTKKRMKAILRPFCLKCGSLCGKIGINPYKSYDCPMYEPSNTKPKIWLSDTLLRGYDVPDDFEIMERKEVKTAKNKEVEWNLSNPFIGLL